MDESDVYLGTGCLLKRKLHCQKVRMILTSVWTSTRLILSETATQRPQPQGPFHLDHLTLELETSLCQDLMAGAPQGSAEPSNRISRPALPAIIAGIDAAT
jgi:hypothetical protein